MTILQYVLWLYLVGQPPQKMPTTYDTESQCNTAGRNAVAIAGQGSQYRCPPPIRVDVREHVLAKQK